MEAQSLDLGCPLDEQARPGVTRTPSTVSYVSTSKMVPGYIYAKARNAWYSSSCAWI